jgi:hypothetical protein
VDWVTIFFFIRLFVIVHGIDVADVLDLAAQRLMRLTGDDARATTIAILWGSAILSAIVDNIPFVAAMIPLIREMGPHLGGTDQVAAMVGFVAWRLPRRQRHADRCLAEPRRGRDRRTQTGLISALRLHQTRLRLDPDQRGICHVYLWLRYR